MSKQLFFGPKVLPQTLYVLMCIKCMNVTKTKCPITMLKFSKSQISRNFEPLIEHGPHWINFIISLSQVKKIDTLEVYIKFGTKLFYLT
jgi:hypothetical protein